MFFFFFQSMFTVLINFNTIFIHLFSLKYLNYNTIKNKQKFIMQSMSLSICSLQCLNNMRDCVCVCLLVFNMLLQKVIVIIIFFFQVRFLKKMQQGCPSRVVHSAYFDMKIAFYENLKALNEMLFPILSGSNYIFCEEIIVEMYVSFSWLYVCYTTILSPI